MVVLILDLIRYDPCSFGELLVVSVCGTRVLGLFVLVVLTVGSWIAYLSLFVLGLTVLFLEVWGYASRI